MDINSSDSDIDNNSSNSEITGSSDNSNNNYINQLDIFSDNIIINSDNIIINSDNIIINSDNIIINSDNNEEEQAQDDEHEHEHEHEQNLNNVYFNINDNIMNIISSSSSLETLNSIDNEHNEIMSWAYENMMNIDDQIVNFIDLCYLKNLQYDDEPIDTIRYTIRSVFDLGSNYELKNLASGIFGYSIIGINLVFNQNFDLLNEILSSELKRLLRRILSIQLLTQMFQSGGQLGQLVGQLGQFGQFGQFGQLGMENMEDVKLVVSKEELDKIPTKLYKDIGNEIKTNNDKCPICHDIYRENDNIRILPCEHIFHTDCINNWLGECSNKCPCCRKEVAKSNPKI